MNNIVNVYLTISAADKKISDIECEYNLTTDKLQVHGKKDSSFFDYDIKIKEMYIVYGDDLVANVEGDFDSGFTVEDSKEFREKILFELSKEESIELNKKIQNRIQKVRTDNLELNASSLGKIYSDFKELPGKYSINLTDGTFLDKDVTLNIFSGEVSFPIKETASHAELVSETASFFINKSLVLCDIVSGNKIDAESQDRILSLFEEYTENLQNNHIKENSNTWKI